MTLIIGTFNPLIEGNKAEWFYDRYDNNFWDVLPRMFRETCLRCSKPPEWKAFCKSHNIAITDLMSCIEDAEPENPGHTAILKTYSDKSIAEKFKTHTTVNIVELLQANLTIKNVFLTRGTSDTFWKRLWKSVEQYATQNNIYENKLITPSGYTFYQQGKYNKQNPLNPLGLEDFLLMKWREKWNNLYKEQL